MRAAVLHPSLNYLGGAVRVCMGFVRALSRAGYDVTLFTVDRTRWDLVRRVFGDVGAWGFRERFIFPRLPGFLGESVRSFLVALFYVVEVFVVRFFLGFDLVVVVGGEIIDCVGDIVYVNAVPLRLMHLFPGLRLGGLAWKAYSRLYDLLLRFLGRVDSRGLLITNSRFLRDVVRRFLGRDSVVVYPPVCVGRFAGLVGLRGERPNLVVSVSRMHTGKFLDVVLEVARRVDGANFMIVSSGSGRFREALCRVMGLIGEMGLGGRVSVLVNEPLDRLLDALSHAKVLLHAQPSEAFGISIVEAMAAGCVPVVPRSGGPWFDILGCRQGVYGFSYNSVGEAAEIVRMLLSDEAMRRSVAERARSRALCFDETLFEGRIMEVLRRLAARR